MFENSGKGEAGAGAGLGRCGGGTGRPRGCWRGLGKEVAASRPIACVRLAG